MAGKGEGLLWVSRRIQWKTMERVARGFDWQENGFASSAEDRLARRLLELGRWKPQHLCSGEVMGASARPGTQTWRENDRSSMEHR